MRRAAILLGVVSILMLATTIWLGYRLSQGDQGVRAIHLSMAVASAYVSLGSHVVAVLCLLLLSRPKA